MKNLGRSDGMKCDFARPDPRDACIKSAANNEPCFLFNFHAQEGVLCVEGF